MTASIKKMPVLFIGHGSPMNAIENNKFTANWERLGTEMPTPKAILAVSAHWYTHGTRVTDSKEPKMVYDMYGFPKELYEIVYAAKGAPELAHITQALISEEVEADNSWGYDHGTWSVLCRMYPKADIPVFQLSVDSNSNAETHFQIGRQLNTLREQGVLIFGSGNVVHNLSRINFEAEVGYPWAIEFDNYIKERIIKRQYKDVIDYKASGKCSELAFTTPDHFYPLLYILGASREEDKLSIFNDSCTMESLSMTSYLFE